MPGAFSLIEHGSPPMRWATPVHTLVPTIRPSTIGSRRVLIKREFVTEIPPFCDIIHIHRVASRQWSEFAEQVRRDGDPDHTRSPATHDGPSFLEERRAVVARVAAEATSRRAPRTASSTA